MKYKNILITGGCGFIGSNLAMRIRKENPKANIYALDNFSREGSRLNIHRLEKSNIKIIEGDVRDREKLIALKEIDLIIDCAAEPSVLAGRDGDPLYVTDVNLGGTLNTLETARLNKADFVFLSTSRVYPIEQLNNISVEENDTRFLLPEFLKDVGVSKEGIAENFPLGESRTLYGATKLASEFFVKEYVNNFGMKAVINRCGVICGPWQFGKVDQGFVTLWLSRHLINKSLSYIGFGGEGKQVRDILHIDDLCDVILLEILNLDKCSGQIYNIGGGSDVNVSLKEMTNFCQEITGNKIKIESTSTNRPGDIKLYISDCNKFKKEFGWRPKKDAKTILRDILNWIKENEKDLKNIFN